MTAAHDSETNYVVFHLLNNTMDFKGNAWQIPVTSTATGSPIHGMGNMSSHIHSMKLMDSNRVWFLIAGSYSSCVHIYGIVNGKLAKLAQNWELFPDSTCSKKTRLRHLAIIHGLAIPGKLSETKEPVQTKGKVIIFGETCEKYQFQSFIQCMRLTF